MLDSCLRPPFSGVPVEERRAVALHSPAILLAVEALVLYFPYSSTNENRIRYVAILKEMERARAARGHDRFAGQPGPSPTHRTGKSCRGKWGGGGNGGAGRSEAVAGKHADVNS